MMKENKIENIYLHIGMSKTATSSIQDTLYANRLQLEKHGVFYSGKLNKNHSDVLRMLFSDAPQKHHTSIKHGLDIEKIREINVENIKIIKEEIAETECRNILYSGESVSAFTKNELNNIKGFFNDLFPEAKLYILISTRNPIDYITSFVQQRRRTSIGSHFDFNFAYKFGKLLDVFGKESIMAFKFEDACRHMNGPVGYFLNLLGVSNEDISDFKIINSNSSISDKAIDIIDFVNDLLPMLGEKGISEGRIHLDYSHFYSLTGNKFQLGKDFFDEYISMDKMSQSCKWLKENMDIDYALKDIPDQTPRIIYDQLFSDEIRNIYGFLTPVLKKLTHEYLKDRAKSPDIDDISKKTLDDLVDWVVNEHKDTEKTSLENIIKLQRAIIANDKKHRNQLLKRFKGDDIRAGQFLRDIALFLEHYEMFEQSYLFMSKAKMYAPTVKIINDKLEEYRDILDKK